MNQGTSDTTQKNELTSGQPGASIPWNLDHQRDPFHCYTGEDWVKEQDKDAVLHRFKYLNQVKLTPCKVGPRFLK